MTNEKIFEKVEQVRQNPRSLFGMDLGTVKKDTYTHQVFFEDLGETKSGKAHKGILKICMLDNNIEAHEDTKPYFWVQGITYLPKFALSNPKWIVEEKLANYSMRIGNQFIISGAMFSYGEKISHKAEFNSNSPERRGEDYVRDMDLIRHELQQAGKIPA